MNSSNILNDLNSKINLLEQSINEIRIKANQETMEMNELSNKMNTIQSQYNLKKIQVCQMQEKLNEKIKISTEARNAYSKIVNTTALLYDSINKEVDK